ncbi:MAG TPA: diguanylate cyclase [Myxococcales bacterium LLY-WYZ-16_1]|nr:diguanylate cyclase [Myxococcales bacterium LLY-WYZ-16_1]
MGARLQTRVEAHRRSKQNIRRLLPDLDRFEEINDSMGHDGGDLQSCLQQVDEALFAGERAAQDRVLAGEPAVDSRR